MIEGLQRFFAELRTAGVRVSPAECLDAVRAVMQCGVDDRDRFRHALRATLVKRASQLPLFDEVFARFFVGPVHGAGGRRREKKGPEAGGRRRGGVSRGEDPLARSRPGQPSPTRPRSAGRRSSSDDAARRLARNLREIREGSRVRWGRLRGVELVARGKGSRRGADAEPGSRLRDLRRERSVSDQRRVADQVRRIIERIRLRTGRRLRRTGSGRPYPRRLFRECLRTGGIPFRLPYRRPRWRTPRVILLVDVSWSTSRAAGLFLAIAGEFLRLGRQTRVILFVDRPVDATERIAGWLARRRDEPFRDLLESVRGLNLGAPSDYGRVFHALLGSPARPRGRNTVCVILGDGRTNVFDPLAWSLDELAADCGAVLWLVPEPAPDWGTGDSALPCYLPLVHRVVEVEDLDGLGRGVTELIRRI